MLIDVLSTGEVYVTLDDPPATWCGYRTGLQKILKVGLQVRESGAVRLSEDCHTAAVLVVLGLFLGATVTVATEHQGRNCKRQRRAASGEHSCTKQDYPEPVKPHPAASARFETVPTWNCHCLMPPASPHVPAAWDPSYAPRHLTLQRVRTGSFTIPLLPGVLPDAFAARKAAKPTSRRCANGAGRVLEGDTDAAAGERRDGVMGEGRAQEVAADSLELFAVATVGGGRGVEIHAEGGEGHRRRRGR